MPSRTRTVLVVAGISTATTIDFAGLAVAIGLATVLLARATSRHYPTGSVRKSLVPAIRVFPAQPSVFADF
jgi:hypothetical protein